MPKACEINSTTWLLTGDEPVEQRTVQNDTELALLTVVRSLPLEHQEAVLALAAPDAELIAKARAFLEYEAEKEAASVRFYDLPSIDWTDADHAEYESLSATATGFHERLEEISMAEVTTPAGLIAKATVMLWITRDPIGEQVHAWNLAESVLQVLGVPLPAWAESEA